jgi:hypothetical protein
MILKSKKNVMMRPKKSYIEAKWMKMVSPMVSVESIWEVPFMKDSLKMERRMAGVA